MAPTTKNKQSNITSTFKKSRNVPAARAKKQEQVNASAAITQLKDKTTALPAPDSAATTPSTSQQKKKAAASPKKAKRRVQRKAIRDEEASDRDESDVEEVQQVDGDAHVEIVQPEDQDDFIEPGLPLDMYSTRYARLYGQAKAQMSGLPPIHGEDDDKFQTILRVFDNTFDYGPCIGVTRLERWERAHNKGLNPPAKIREILLSLEGVQQDKYKQTVFYGRV